MADINNIIRKQTDAVKLDETEHEKLAGETKKIVDDLKRKIDAKKIKAQIFVGGSLAKGTIIKKRGYDIDIFVRFDKKHSNISELLSKSVSGERVHGSRDYFKIKRDNIIFEIIPVLEIKKPEEAKNITDLSYFHVAYITGKIKKNKKLADEIIAAKAFCYAQKCYGAESYIHGFSGYALELIISYYGSFLKFIKEAAKKEKIVIDPEKDYKNKEDIMNNLNEAKLQSPIVLIDPTFKERNALAALSEETYSKFREVCKKFLKSPSKKFFELQSVDDKKYNLIIDAESSKQEGDVAGSKLLKFFRFLSWKLDKYFLVKGKDFEYEKKARYFFNLEKRKEIIFTGPPVKMAERVLEFKSEHKDSYTSNGRINAREKSNINIKTFLENFKKENKSVLENMGISRLFLFKSNIK